MTTFRSRARRAPCNGAFRPTRAYRRNSTTSEDANTALGKLQPEQREVILLVGLEGMSYEEVAEVLEIPVGTVRSRLSRGRDQLRLLMGMEGKNERLRAA
jgi:RNA polymerase sigma factor (sigma-70 family)